MAWLPACAVLLLTVLWAGQAAGQSALERLEREIRNRLAAPGSAAPQALPAAKQAPAGSPPSDAGSKPDGRGQAYFGAVTVDALERGRGVRVTEVVPGSPAQTAGIQPGDLLTGLGGVRIRTLQDFDEIMKEVRPGMTLTAELLRGKEPLKVNVTFARSDQIIRPAAMSGGEAKPKPDANKPPVSPPLRAEAGDKPPAVPKGVMGPASAPKVPPPPPEPAQAGDGPLGVAGPRGAGGPARMPLENGKAALLANTGDTEARLAALEARLRELEGRIARLEEALRAAQAAKAEP